LDWRCCCKLPRIGVLMGLLVPLQYRFNFQLLTFNCS
jgi:hypothetical protein